MPAPRRLQPRERRSEPARGAAPPAEAHELAAWFAEAVCAELADLERKGSDQRYELHGGHRVTPEQSPYAIYRFTLADNTLVPEDSTGKIDVEGRLFTASVVAQEISRVDVQIEDAQALGPFVARAILQVNDLALLRKLAEVLQEVAGATTEPVSHLATDIFHPSGVCKLPLPSTPVLDRITGEQRAVLEQASASKITFVWGPPGTGKTYVIAHLIAALIARGERVLITSHTHAAVDQSIYETIKPGGDGGPGNAGPLADTDLEHEAKIIWIGRVTNLKVPKSVRLDSIVERKSNEIELAISELERKAGPLSERQACLNAQLAEWAGFSELRRRLDEAEGRRNGARTLVKRRLSEEDEARARVQECRKEVDKAARAWLFRARRVEHAGLTLATAERAHAVATKSADGARAAAHDAEMAVESLRVETNSQAGNCAQLPTAEDLNQQVIPVNEELRTIEVNIKALKTGLETLQKEVIANARVVAATLTKCYVGPELEGQSFDAVIVDEISMALPPLLFIAGLRALRRVILVGDFKQLPPIVRGDSEITDERLRQDAFHLARIAHQMRPTDHPALARLREQRRMLRPIADMARSISYGPDGLKDHSVVLQRVQPEWLTFLRANALLIVDTADLHCWCGRRAGNLSRFNLYSAQIAAELAAMAASAIPEPAPSGVRPIGIVTPYAAQRRLLLSLVEALELTPWVAVGTVHTFQGGEAELIIFDSVLDDPYWTARLCDPNSLEEVRRDLNVALTRARSKFVLVGSSEWLNRRAKATSGLGQLWHYMTGHADLVPAHELVEVGFAGRVAGGGRGTYQIPADAESRAQEVLDESTFYGRFETDLRNASGSVVGLVPFFGKYRWPKIEPLLHAALERGVEVTLITPPAAEAQDRAYVEAAIRSLRQLGAVVVASSGLHGKDIVIDSRIHYTGSLNWASHRGRAEIMHRTESPEYARLVLEYLQARHIRSAGQQGNQPRICPECHGPTQVVNQARPMRKWDIQPIKLGCAGYQNTGCKYLVDIDQRRQFLEAPRCRIDQQTKYRRVRRGRGERWECPKHPKECKPFKVVRGDPVG